MPFVGSVAHDPFRRPTPTLVPPPPHDPCHHRVEKKPQRSRRAARTLCAQRPSGCNTYYLGRHFMMPRTMVWRLGAAQCAPCFAPMSRFNKKCLCVFVVVDVQACVKRCGFLPGCSHDTCDTRACFVVAPTAVFGTNPQVSEAVGVHRSTMKRGRPVADIAAPAAKKRQQSARLDTQASVMEVRRIMSQIVTAILKATKEDVARLGGRAPAVAVPGASTYEGRARRRRGRRHRRREARAGQPQQNGGHSPSALQLGELRRQRPPRMSRRRRAHRICTRNLDNAVHPRTARRIEAATP